MGVIAEKVWFRRPQLGRQKREAWLELIRVVLVQIERGF